MDEFLAFLNAIKPVSPELAAHLRKIFVLRHFKKNTFLIRAGSINDKMFFITRGLVRCYSLKGHVEKSKWFLKTGDVIASTESFRLQAPGTEYMQALMDTTVVFTTFPELEATYLRYPELERHGRIVTQRYSMLWYTLLDGIRMNSARERYRFLRDRYPDLVQLIPQKYLASYLGFNEITLSRIRASV